MTKRKPPELHKKPGRPKSRVSDENQGQQVQAKLGRPRKLEPDERTLLQVSQFGAAQMPPSEAAGLLGVSETTFKAFLARNPEAQEAWEAGSSKGKGVIRVVQFNKAKSGNTDMLKWWGKQYLGQAEKQDTTNAGAGGGPIQVEGKLSDDERAKLAAEIAALLE